MLDHNWLIDLVNFVILNHMNERFVLVVVVYDEDDDKIEISEFHQK